MSKIHLKILTPERSLYDGEVEKVSLPSKDGEITILPHHIPLISLLKAGEIRIDDGKSIVPLVTSGGFIEIHENTIKVLADTAEKVDEIDEQRALEVQKRAQEALVSKQLDAKEHAYFLAKLEKQLARTRLARKYRK